MIHFRCECGNVLFFENTRCLQCNREVGYHPDSGRFELITDDSGYARCGNGIEFNVCNWVVRGDSQERLCASCQLNRMIPDLSVEGNLQRWSRLEAAKRRMIYTLWQLGLRPTSKAIDPDGGLAFDFLAPTPTQRVMTGHDNGLITINILEADDAYREKERNNLREPYRTLVGHFRHEVGHYYWDRMFKGAGMDSPRYAQWRELFGDETVSYAEALQKNYNDGPPSDWAEHYISAYASCHPWEDWAETWAQYLQIVDGIETAGAFGIESRKVPIPFTPFDPEAADCAENGGLGGFLQTVNSWAKLAPALNEISASLGHPNAYPFVFSPAAVKKICFVHSTVPEWAAEQEKPRPQRGDAKANDDGRPTRPTPPTNQSRAVASPSHAPVC